MKSSRIYAKTDIKYLEIPNLEEQIHEPDSWGSLQDMISAMLDEARDIFNTKLIWLGTGEVNDDRMIPIFGHRSGYAGKFYWRQELITYSRLAFESVYHIKADYPPFDLFNIDSHYVAPFENGSEFPGHVWYDTLLAKVIPDELWPSFHRRKMPYKDYLETTHWDELRWRLSDEYNERCALCNRHDKLQPHHRTYERRGHEIKGDVIPLCRWCHEAFHKVQVLDEKS